MSHRLHPNPEIDPEDAILFDDCEDCARHAKTPGLTLDYGNWWRMWDRMEDVELGSGHYRSDNEATLGRQFYNMFIALERYTNVNPRELRER